MDSQGRGGGSAEAGAEPGSPGESIYYADSTFGDEVASSHRSFATMFWRLYCASVSLLAGLEEGLNLDPRMISLLPTHIHRFL